MSALVLTALVVLGATAYDETFGRANAAYHAGDYEAAVEMYEQLIAEDIVHPAVFYNLGNAYYRSSRLGPAIANYERALRISPGFENAAENLGQCVSETERRLARPLPADWEQSLLFWHYNLGPGATRASALVLWFAFWIVLGIRQCRPVRYSRAAALALAVLVVAFGMSAWAKSRPAKLAVASAERVPVYYGTDETSTTRFELFDGDRVTVERRANGWARVRISDGERGWAREGGLTFVGPPYERAPALEAAPSEEANSR